MISDSEIKKNVEAELQWDPDIKMTDIGVSVKDGVVGLTGFVSTLPQKFQTEIDVKRIVGVRGVANDIEVRLPNVDKRPDPEIARDAVTALHFQLPIAYGNVKVVVRDGWIILDGELVAALAGLSWLNQFLGFRSTPAEVATTAIPIAISASISALDFIALPFQKYWIQLHYYGTSNNT